MGWGKGGRLKKEPLAYMHICKYTYMYNYGLFVLYSRNQHNIKAIFLQLKNKLKKKEVLPRWLSDVDLISGSGRSPGEGQGNPLQYSFLENPMDRGAWQAAVYRVTKSRT